MLWDQLGFRKNIFFVEALEPIDDEMELFVGNSKDIEKFLIDCLSGERGLKIVTGQLGVGKTTFVNACQYYSYNQFIPNSKLKPDRTLICYPKIQIQESDNVESVIQKVISSICNSIVRYSDKKNFGHVNDLIKYFTSLSLSTGGTQFQANADLFGTGAGLSVTAPGKQYKDVITWRPKLEELVQYIQDELEYKGVFIVINNLEIATKEKLNEVLNPLRDLLFDIKGLYYILIGYSGITSTIISEIPRLKDYISGIETTIVPMSYSTMLEVIQKRVDKYRIDTMTKNPLSSDAIEIFHYMSLQEARTTMKICSEVIKKIYTKQGASKSISYIDAMSAFIDYCGDEAKQIELTENNKRILESIFKNHMVRPKDFESFGYSSKAGFHSALKALTKKGLLQIKSGGSNARFYQPTGMTMVAGITGALGDDIQRITAELLREKEKAQKAIRTRKVAEPQQYFIFVEEDEDQ
jgi:GTPase SAR1 family protein